MTKTIEAPAASEQLLELAARCEAATGPDRCIDHDILGFADPEIYGLWVGAANSGMSEKANPFKILPYTASLDAAMTLVPEGWAGIIGIRSDVGCRLQPDTDHPSVCVEVQGSTSALALCAAALKARAGGAS